MSYFSTEQLQTIYPEDVKHHYWTVARNKIIISFLKNNGLKGKKMIEIGSGNGVVLHALRAYGFDCIGIEPSAGEAPDEVKSFLYRGVDIETCDPTLYQGVEVALLFDVIEHIEKPDIFLRIIKEKIPSLTHVVISVPASMKLWSEFDAYNGHHRRYTFRMLEALFERTLLKKKTMVHFFHMLYIPMRFCTIFGIKRSISVTPPRGCMRLFHALFGIFFFLEYKILPGRIPGSSILAIADVSPRTQ